MPIGGLVGCNYAKTPLECRVSVADGFVSGEAFLDAKKGRFQHGLSCDRFPGWQGMIGLARPLSMVWIRASQLEFCQPDYSADGA